MAAASLENFEDGHNVLYIALGQNAGGKTYTLFGEEQTDGLIARIVGELINRNNTKYSLHIEASEFYLIHIGIFSPNLLGRSRARLAKVN